MKSFFILFITCFSQMPLYAQTTFNIRPTFSHVTAGLLTSVVATDSCYYMSGTIRDTISPFLTSNLFAKFDLDGNLEFDKILLSQERTYETWTNSLTPMNDGNFTNIGYSYFINGNPMKAFFIKMNDMGDTIFTQECTYPNS